MTQPTPQPTSTPTVRSIETLPSNVQEDIYVVAKESIITSPLAVLITLIVTGIGLAILIQRLGNSVTPLISKYIEAQIKFSEEAGERIKDTSETVEDIHDKADKHYTDTSLHSVLVIEKLNRIEAEIRDIKSSIINSNK